MSNDQSQESAEEPSRPQFGGRRQLTLDKNGQPRRGFTDPEFQKDYWTPERREEQRQRALEQQAAGKWGGGAGYHRRRTKKAQEILAEKFQEQADVIWNKLWAMIEQSGNKNLQLAAIDRLAQFEDWAVKNAREDVKEFRKLSGQQLDERLLELMGESLGLDFSQFKEQMQNPVIEGHATELDPCESCTEAMQDVAAVLRDSGIRDDELVIATASRARCDEHKEIE